MILAIEDANSKLLDVVNVADFNAEGRFYDSLVETLKLKFYRNIEHEL